MTCLYDNPAFLTFHLGSESAMTDHEKELLDEYKKREGVDQAAAAAGKQLGGGKAGGPDGSDVYENVLPKHGDALFHKMMSVISQNPGQILR